MKTTPTVETLVLRTSDRSGTIEALLARLVEEGTLTLSDAVEVREKMDRRHAMGPPTLGKGLAVPHARHGSVSDYVIRLALLKRPNTDWDAIDGEPIDIVLLVLGPMETVRGQLPFFERLYHRFANGLGERLRQCATTEELDRVLWDEDDRGP